MYGLNGALFAASINLADLGPISVKYSVDLSAINSEPVVSTPFWAKHEEKSDLN